MSDSVSVPFLKNHVPNPRARFRYLTNAGQLDHGRLEMLMARLGALELSVLEDRAAVSGGVVCVVGEAGKPAKQFHMRRAANST